MMVKGFFCEMAAGVDKIHLEILKALDVVEVTWFIHCFIVAMKGSMLWVQECFSYRECTFQPPWEILCQGPGQDSAGLLKRNNADSSLAMKQ